MSDAKKLGLTQFFKNRDKTELILLVPASLSILIIFLIALFTLWEGIPAFASIGPKELLTGSRWAPYYGRYGAFPLIYGSLMVVLGSILIAVPLGVLSAIFIAEYMPRRLRDFIKPIIELLAAIPSIIYGFLAMVFIAPVIMGLFEVPLGRTALTASIVLSVMVVPTITSISSEVIASVPREYRIASMALGAAKWQVTKSVVLPTAMPGIVASILLAFGRAIGETVAVLMASGSVATIPTPFWNYLDPVHMLTAAIALGMGEVPVGSMHYHALFGLGVILLVITLIVNALADRIMRKMPREVVRI